MTEKNLFRTAISIGTCVSLVVYFLSPKGRKNFKKSTIRAKELTCEAIRYPHETSLLIDKKCETATRRVIQVLDSIHDLANHANEIIDKIDQ